MKKDEFMILCRDEELDLERMADSYWDLNQKCIKLMNKNDILKKRSDRKSTLLSDIQILINEYLRED